MELDNFRNKCWKKKSRGHFWNYQMTYLTEIDLYIDII